MEAAALPLAGMTAWQSLVDVGHLAAGQRVLVHAAAGGVGHLAVQIAKARGAHVIGTASAAKHDLLRSLGCDEVVDHRLQRFEDVVGPVDLVHDLIGAYVRPAGPGLTELLDLHADGRLRVVVAETFPLERAADAHRLGERGRTTGKIVLTV